jgi:serine/threonine protein phosphatase PrpC
VRRLITIGALGLMLASLLAIVWPVPARSQQTTLSLRPREAVAYAELAVVRLAVEYYGQTVSGTSTTLNAGPVACTGLGAIVGDSGTGSNTHTYVLTDARLISPVTPCTGLIAAYIGEYGSQPTTWKLKSITAYLNTAYTGVGSSQVGAISFELDISAIPTLGLSGGPIALPLLNEPPFDLPMIQVPTSQTQPAQLLDLGNSTTQQPYVRDTLQEQSLVQALTPIESGSTLPPTASATPQPRPGISPTSDATASATPKATTVTPAPTATPMPATISLGAPVIDDEGNGFGNLAGIVVSSNGGTALATITQIDAALQMQSVASQPGEFDQRWHAGLDAFYKASPTNPHDPSYAAAADQFSALQQHYPAFQGIIPWLEAARAGSPDLGASAAPTATPSPQAGLLSTIEMDARTYTRQIAAAAVAIAALLLVIILWRGAARSRRRGMSAPPAAERSTKGMPALAGAGADFIAPTEIETTRPWRSVSANPTLPLPRNQTGRHLGMQVAAMTDRGTRRRDDPNQDNILAMYGARLFQGVPQPVGLFIVADGMGGHQFGREASSRAIKTMSEHIMESLMDNQALDHDDLLALLRTGVEHANRHLHQRNVHQHADMGTTVTAALVAGDVAHVVNVGDSRTYHLKTDLPLRPVTTDHSVVAGLVAAGVIHPDDVYTHPKRNQIYRSLGEKEDVLVDTFQIYLQPGEHLLLCSDGLWEMVRDPRMEEMIRGGKNVHDVVRALVDEANANGGVDNISVILVRMLDESKAPTQVGLSTVASPEMLPD